MAEILAHFHGGPLSGQRLVVKPKHEQRVLDLTDPKITHVYVADETSAGGRCYDYQGKQS